MNKFISFEQNTTGRDFVVGDVHGQFDTLAGLLAQVDFNTDTDRLFSVGDLIDRGPQSEQAVEWIAQPWFHAVRGNHEQLAIDAEDGVAGMAECHLANGGLWFLRLSEEQRAYMATVFDSLPYAIEVETARGLIGIVHAEPSPDWRLLKAELLAETEPRRAVLNSVLWARSRINDQSQSMVGGVERVYVGHTPVDRPVMLGNVCYIDIGAGFNDGSMLLVDMSNNNALMTSAKENDNGKQKH